jgi:O-antigen/teichoic acid export membrane protein
VEKREGADAAGRASASAADAPSNEFQASVARLNPRSTLIRNTLANGLNYAVVVLSALILTPLVIKGFGTAVYGVWILINQLTGYAGLLDVGIQPAVSKRVAEARADGNRDALRNFLASAFWLNGSVAAATFLLGLVFSLVFPGWFRLEGVTPADARLAVIIVGLTTAFGFPGGVFSAVLKGELRFDLVSWIGIIGQAFRVVGLALALHFHGGVVGLALSGLLAAGVTLVGGAVFARRVLGPRYLRHARSSWSDIRGITHFGIFTLLSTAGWYLSYATDAAIIGALLTVADVAHFGLAVNVLVILSGIVGAFSGTLMPVAAQLETGGRRSDTQNTYLVSTRICLTLMIPAVAVLLLAGPDLLVVWVGRDFGSAAGPILQVLSIAHFAVIVNGPGFHMGVGMGLNRPIALLSLGEGLFNVALSYVLAKRMGVIGVAIGTLIPSVLAHGIALPAMVRSHLGISRRRFLRGAVAPAAWPLGPAALIGAAWWWLLRPVPGAGMIVLAAVVGTTYALCAAASFHVNRRRTR